MSLVGRKDVLEWLELKLVARKLPRRISPNTEKSSMLALAKKVARMVILVVSLRTLSLHGSLVLKAVVSLAVALQKRLKHIININLKDLHAKYVGLLIGLGLPSDGRALKMKRKN